MQKVSQQDFITWANSAYLDLVEEIVSTNKLDKAPTPQQLARWIIELSEHYLGINTTTNESRRSPWHSVRAQLAYLSYFHPLSLARVFAALSEKPEFFSDLDHLVDWGAGAGAASLVWRCFSKLQSLTLFEPEKSALDLAQRLHQSWNTNLSDQAEIIKISATSYQFDFATCRAPDKTALIFSLSLNELGSEDAVVATIQKAIQSKIEAFIILEPATRTEARRLQSLRALFIDSGYSIWAPCTHQNSCPLLPNTSDWCHFREQPLSLDSLKTVSPLLPMHNQFDRRSLALSFLLVRRRSSNNKLSARIVSDGIRSKGKHELRVCRSSRAERLVAMTGRISKNHLAHFESLSRGDEISISHIPSSSSGTDSKDSIVRLDDVQIAKIEKV